MSIPTVALYASDKEIGEVWKEWSRYQECARCGKYFNLLDSFGKWGCTQHPYGSSTRVISGRNGFTHDETRYWKCCKVSVIPMFYSNRYDVWRNFSTSFCNKNIMPKPPEIVGCLKCDHSATKANYDDGFRDGIQLNQLAPLGGWKLGDSVIFNNNLRNIIDIKWDGSMTLADVDMEVAAASVSPTQEWKEELREKWEQSIENTEPLFCNVAMPDSIKCKILRWNRNDDNNIIIQLKELGTPLHGVAAMLPFMAEVGKDDPMERPGFKEATSEFPFISRAQLRNIPE